MKICIGRNKIKYPKERKFYLLIWVNNWCILHKNGLTLIKIIPTIFKCFIK